MNKQPVNYPVADVFVYQSKPQSSTITPAEQDLKRLVSGGEHHSARIRVCRLQTAVDSELLGFVDSKGDFYSVKAALSCLIQPQVGDLVQVLQSHTLCWVLAVLERDTQQALQLDFGTQTVNINAQRMTLNVAEQLQFKAEQIRDEANVLIQTAADRQSHIQGTDSTYVGSMALKAERHLGIHAGMANLKAKSLLKIDAAQIHMG